MPAGSKAYTNVEHDWFASTNVPEFMAYLREKYDVIIFDMGPMDSSMDAAALAPFLDGFVVLVEWGKTQATDAVQMLNGTSELKRKISGFVITKTPVQAREKFWASKKSKTPKGNAIVTWNKVAI